MSADKPHIGFAGLGQMGRPMARQRLGSGFALSIYDRTASVASEFAGETGVAVATDLRDLGEWCSVIVAMLSDGAALLALLDDAAGLMAGLSAGDVFIDMGTSGCSIRPKHAGGWPRLEHTSSRRPCRAVLPLPSPASRS